MTFTKSFSQNNGRWGQISLRTLDTKRKWFHETVLLRDEQNPDWDKEAGHTREYLGHFSWPICGKGKGRSFRGNTGKRKVTVWEYWALSACPGDSRVSLYAWEPSLFPLPKSNLTSFGLCQSLWRLPPPVLSNLTTTQSWHTLLLLMPPPKGSTV